jgi:hypothetical protein
MGSAGRDHLVGGKPTSLASPPRKHLGSQPDAAGHATRLAAAAADGCGLYRPIAMNHCSCRWTLLVMD